MQTWKAVAEHAHDEADVLASGTFECEVVQDGRLVGIRDEEVTYLWPFEEGRVL